MHLLLTNFHMYLEIIVLVDINTNTWENIPKGAFQQSAILNCAKGLTTKAHLPRLFERNTTQGAAQAHSRVHRAKAVATRAGQGGAAPLLAPLGHSFVWRCPGDMRRRWRPGFPPNISSTPCQPLNLRVLSASIFAPGSRINTH